MRKLIATVFNYSVDGLLADQDTEFWKFCFDLPENRDPDDPEQLDFLRNAHAHIMGLRLREHLRADDDQHRPPLLPDPERRAQGRLLADPEDGRLGRHHHRRGRHDGRGRQLRLGGDGHIVVWGGVGFWRSLMVLDLIDEVHISMFPYVAGEGTRLFDGVPKSYALDLISSIPSSNGIVELQYRRPR